MRNKNAGLGFLFSQPWCMAFFGLERMLAILEARALGENGPGISMAQEIRKSRGEALMFAQSQANNKTQAKGHKQIMMIPIHGMLMSRMGGMEDSGIMSQQSIADAVARAGENKEIGGIILHVDSPGGTAAGNEEAGTIIRQVAREKPMATFVSGEGMYSAAFWLGSQSGNIFLAGDTVGSGSIGTVYGYCDDSKALENKGYQIYWFRSGKYKALGGDGEKLTPDHYEQITRALESKQAAFIKNVALGLGITEEQTLQVSGEGDIWYGQHAVQQGVAHGVGSLHQVIHTVTMAMETGQQVRAEPFLPVYTGPTPRLGKKMYITQSSVDPFQVLATPGVTPPVANPVRSGKEKDMTPEELKEKHPTLYQAIYGAGLSEGRKETMSAVALEMGHVGEGFDLKTYAQQANDGKGYRDHLEGRLLQVCVTMHGAEKGQSVSARMAAGFKTLPVKDLEEQVVMMETEAQSKIPPRLSTESPAAPVPTIRQEVSAEVMDFGNPTGR